jgi:elongator complex protein 3
MQKGHFGESPKATAKIKNSVFCQKIIEKCLAEKPKTEKELLRIKRWAAKIFKITAPPNITLNRVYQNLLKKKKIKRNKNLEGLLKKRKVRSLSGVAVVSVLTKPYPCPGKCIYCPTEKGIPKSYLSGEPAVQRAKALKYNPYLQVKKRIEMLELEGHPTDKIELRVIGGCFSSYPKKYKENFIKRCFESANAKARQSVRKKTRKIKTLKAVQKENEKAKHRIVGISIETRPDLINKNEIILMRELGITMVEIGVQTIFDKILKICKRGHGIKETIGATKLLKDAGFKVMYHLMPNLPGSSQKLDEKMFKEVFENENFKPDWLKIYPCVATKEAQIYKLYKQKRWKPYSDKELINLLKNVKPLLPYWVRVARIYRDIPSDKIVGGSLISNIREVVKKEMKAKGVSCRCIRCREVKEKYNPEEKIFLFRQDYKASGGKEIFLSFETKNRKKLYSYLRLRLPSFIYSRGRIQISRTESERALFGCLKNSAIIREIHTFGKATPIGKKIISPQHKGLGKKLIKEAEKIVKKEFKIKKIAVIAGVGTREYWKKQGYKLFQTYMVKKLF